MKAKKTLYIMLVTVILITTGISCFFLGRFSYKKSIKIDNNVAESNGNFDSKKTYELNENIKTDLFEICFKEISFNDTICTMQYHKAEEGHEEFLKAIQKRDVSEGTYGKDFLGYEHIGELKSHISGSNYDEKSASDGMTFVTIEYTIKNISPDMIDLKDYESFSKFSLIYDNKYNFVDNTATTSNNLTNFFVESENGDDYKIWKYITNTNYEGCKLNHLSDEIRVREYIMTSNVVKNEDKNLILKKVVRNTPQEITTNDEICVRIR